MQKIKSIYGLIGNPVAHSLSPIMHNAAFKALGKDAVYKLFPLEEDELEGFFAQLRDKHNPILGLNVTVPYKEKALGFMDNLSAFTRLAKAVNTVVITKDRRFAGHNTDGPGFLAHLTELDFNPSEKRISLIGAGGAARAIITAFCLCQPKPEAIRIYDIDRERSDELIRDLGERMDVSMVKTVNALDDLNIELADLLINATPVGMREDDGSLIEEDLLHSDMLVYDLIYNPPETMLLKAARNKGAKTANGLGMLYYQGVLAFQHWIGLALDQRIKKIMRQSLKKGYRK